MNNFTLFVGFKAVFTNVSYEQLVNFIDDDIRNYHESAK